MRKAGIAVRLIAAAMTTAVAGLAPAMAYAQESNRTDVDAAAATVTRLQRALLDASAYPDVAARFDLLRPEIVATHDLAYIGQLSVRRHWREFTAEQRREFLERFEALSVMTYAARFVGVTQDSLRLDAAEALDDGRIQVHTSVARADESRVPIEYLLQADADSADGDERWRIVNVIADGVSDLALKRAEYRALLDQGGFGELLEALEQQIEALAR